MKIDVNELNKKIIKDKMKNPLYVLDELDNLLLNVPYQSRNRNKKRK